jgi:hypothetical protein
VFIYSERQKELAGKDGEEEFSRVFGAEARTVVILFRPKWGTNRFTRIEQDAIRSRAFDEGYDFTTFISLDDSSVPKWLPRTRLWIGMAREGVIGAAAILEARIQEAGGFVHEETFGEQAARIARAIEMRTEQANWLETQDAAVASTAEIRTFCATLSQRVVSLKAAQKVIPIEYESKEQYERLAVVRTPFASVFLSWEPRYTNTRQYAEIRADEYEGAYLLGRRSDEKLKRRSSRVFQFSLNESDEPGWRDEKRPEEFFTTTRLAEMYLRRLLDEYNSKSAENTRAS